MSGELNERQALQAEGQAALRRLVEHYHSFFSHPPRFLGCRLTGEQLRECSNTLNRVAARLREIEGRGAA